MNKILYIASYENLRFKGGIYTIASRIISSVDLFREKGIAFSFLSSCQIPREIENTGKWSSENFRNAWALRKAIRKEVKKHSFDKVVLNTSNSWAFVKDVWLCRFTQKSLGLKTTLHIHYSDFNQILPENGVVRRLVKLWLNKYVSQLIFLNKYTEQQFIEEGYTGNTAVVPNFYLTEAKCILPRQSDKLQLLYVGTIDKRKGFDQCVELLKDFSGQVTLHVAGEWTDPEFKAEMTQRIKAMKLNADIVFEGFVEKARMTQLLEESDVLLLFSQNEGMSMAMLDGMQAGLAMMPSNIAPHKEVFEGSSIPLFDLDNLTLAKEHLTHLSEDINYLEQQKNNSKSLSISYSFEQFVEHYALALLK